MLKDISSRRDRMMLLILYNTGVRVSELPFLNCRDVVFDGSGSAGYVHVKGKGRKERNIPLWKTTASYIKKYTEEHSLKPNDKLFLNHSKDEFTRSGVRYRIDCLAEKA